MKSQSILVILGLGLAISPTLDAKPAIGKRMIRHRPVVQPAAGDVNFRTSFAVLAAIPKITPSSFAAETPARSLSGTTIAAIGQDAVVLDSETGTLSLLNGKSANNSVQIGKDAGLMAVDPVAKKIYVSDRQGDKVVVLAYGDKLQKLESFKTTTEPYGLALTPDGKTLLVTTVAGRRLQAFHTGSGEERWGMDIGPEARAVAVSPDGKDAVVTFLNTGAIARVKLTDKPTMRFEALANLPMPLDVGVQGVPERFARSAFAATYVGDTAVVAYQQSTPTQVATNGRESRGTYGGSAEGNPPIMQRLAFLPRAWNSPGRAHVNMQMPRAVAYNSKKDNLLIADMGNDEVVVISHSSEPSIQQERRIKLQHAGDRCGPDGVAMADNGDILVNCSFDKRVVRVSDNNILAWSSPMAQSRLSKAAQRGRALFHKGSDSRLSMSGALACANCHPEARNDGLSWRIEGTELQTPLLAGRMTGTHPFKWDGQDKDLQTSLMKTTVRLGGSGIGAKDAKDLQAYLESLPTVRVATDQTQLVKASQKRGKKLFNSATTGCRSCHSGKNYSDGKTYEFSDDIPHVNTPSLLGLAASAPYYHDGSAKTLRDLVLENGSVHGMGKMGSLKTQEVDDLVAFLETL